LILFSLQALGTIRPPSFEYGISGFLIKLGPINDHRGIRKVSKELAQYIYESEMDYEVSTKLSILTEQLKRSEAFNKEKAKKIIREVTREMYRINAHINYFKILPFTMVLFVALNPIVDAANLQSVLGLDLTAFKGDIPFYVSMVFHLRQALKINEKYKSDVLDKHVLEFLNSYSEHIKVGIYQNTCVNILSAKSL
jgi:hypothetical protein